MFLIENGLNFKSWKVLEGNRNANGNGKVKIGKLLCSVVSTYFTLVFKSKKSPILFLFKCTNFIGSLISVFGEKNCEKQKMNRKGKKCGIIIICCS